MDIKKVSGSFGHAVIKQKCAGSPTVVDLDGPLLLAKDHQDGLAYEGSTLSPPEPALWG